MVAALVLALPRFAAGLLMTGHGLQKLAGWLAGRGLTGTEAMLTALRARPARWWSVGLALAETVGGVLMAVGLVEPLGQIAVVAVLAAAIALVRAPKGLWNHNGGYEYPLLLAIVAIATGLAPAGASLDTALGIALPGWLATLAAIGAIAAVGLAVVSRQEWFHGRLYRGRRQVVGYVRYVQVRRSVRDSR